MNTNSTLEHSDYENYLVFLYFGAGPYDLSKCINRAYLDFSRTLHGLGRLAPEVKKELYEQAVSELKQCLSNLRDSADTMDEKGFDDWHRATYQQLLTIYNNYGYNTPKRHFFVGQAQKWINMTFKYIFTLAALNEKQLSGFGKVYPFCHAPIDTVLIAQLDSKKYGIPWPHQCTWSRLDDYDEYLAYQERIRRKFSLVPLDVEFRLWLGEDVDVVDAT